ncbi:FKBP-type peptidyl-prolyl cis-trans isomerase [Leucobacter viscericola]|uniref:Peptidyl-prolyl cis-trans isomerase n=1 Tax=Leucobacter viscericola TaxID=2714935 RepID=A0A6G7XDR1_9MICO|nr:FKBP-type peptidyl-prolyl cis-trans isomerase [Leucobacter viscericola]QIK62750.1 FKBP-type peptidyl-prolyl cis-trans isomerase [Leucobacter viscericola]
MKRTRTLIPVALVAALLLSGCAAGGTTKDASGKECLPSGEASNAVKVSGEVGKDLKLTSKTPVKSKESQRTVMEEGKGDLPKSTESINVAMTIFSGVDGKVIQQAPESAVPVAKDGLSAWAYDAFRCAIPGQEIALVTPVKEVTGGQDPANAGLEGVKNTDSLVMVMKFGKIAKAEGTEKTAETCDKLKPRDKKYPEVDLGDGKSEPKITIPKCIEPPKDLEIKVLKEGKGATIKEGDKVMTNYVGVDWNGAVRFDGNWTATGVEFDTTKGALIEGFTAAMVGQKIGSIVQVTVPPEQGYKDGMTRTFVLELVSEAK